MAVALASTLRFVRRPKIEVVTYVQPEIDMTAHNAPVFVIDDLSIGPYAHGFGQTRDGRTFAFQVRDSTLHRRTLHVEVYRADLETTVPDSSDIEAFVDRSVVDVDLCDERSISAAVRDAVAEAESIAVNASEGNAVRALLSRITSAIS
ncbi:hypothetical protein [Hoyosella altamirensis]|uniref:Uncharacterized protein n=1 Tax=Hoyosella altamirensis TaxID=616997 RepID=A0A839RU24_9ACTN|nr:hypothetical protein [Hoyosella altamirensis]MBB3039827.1 hypothetical protein [Hoyosella altamirensis]